MRLIKNTTELIGIKDSNMTISFVFEKILTLRFKKNWIIQHLGWTFLKTCIAIMNQYDKKSLPYRALKNY